MTRAAWRIGVPDHLWRARKFPATALERRDEMIEVALRAHDTVREPQYELARGDDRCAPEAEHLPDLAPVVPAHPTRDVVARPLPHGHPDLLRDPRDARTRAAIERSTGEQVRAF